MFDLEMALIQVKMDCLRRSLEETERVWKGDLFKQDSNGPGSLEYFVNNM